MSCFYISENCLEIIFFENLAMISQYRVFAVIY